MFQVYKGSISTANEISGKIYDMSSFRYAINADFTFEIPAMTFSTSLNNFAFDDTIIVVKKTDTAQQVKFYVRTVKYDYERRLYVIECEHVLGRLRRYKAREIQTPATASNGSTTFSTEWCDIVLPAGSWNLYNRQTFDYDTGDSAWKRQYFQVIFLIKVLIHRADGVSVANIADALGTKTSFYGTAGTSWRTFAQIGIPGQSVIRMGMKHYLDIISEDYDVEQGLATCFDVLRELCKMLMCQIDVYRSDYRIDTVDMSEALPADGAVGSREDSEFEQYRTYSMKQELLNFTDAYERDFQFGAVNSGGTMELYTWGTDEASPDRTVVERKNVELDSDVPLPKSLDVSFARFIRPYEIIVDTYNGNRSHIAVMFNSAGTLSENYMYMLGLMGKWTPLVEKTAVSMNLPGILMKGVATEVDIAGRPMSLRYERYGT